MGYSSNPEIYSEEEQAIMLSALGRNIELTFPSTKAAFNQRGRFYGLRKAVVTALQQNLRYKKNGMEELCSKLEVVERAMEIQKVGIGWVDEAKTTIVLGRGVGNKATQSILRAALGTDFTSKTDEIHQEAAAKSMEMMQFVDEKTGEVDMEAYLARNSAKDEVSSDDVLKQYYKTGEDDE